MCRRPADELRVLATVGGQAIGLHGGLGCGSLIGRRTPGGAVLKDDAAVAACLLDEGHVAAVPGIAFGLSPYVRVSTAAGEAVLAEAVTRIDRAVAQVE